MSASSARRAYIADRAIDLTEPIAVIDLEQTDLTANLSPNGPTIINLEDYEDSTDSTLCQEGDPQRPINVEIRLPDTAPTPIRPRQIQPMPNISTTTIDPEGHPSYREIALIRLDTCTLRRKNFVELTDGDFAMITYLAQNFFNPTKRLLKGLRFRRNSRMGGILERRRNEICLLLYNQTDESDVWNGSQEVIKPDQILGPRKLVTTNRLFPDASYREDQTIRRSDVDWITAHAALTCRWKFTEYKTKHDECLQRLSLQDCDTLGGSTVVVDEDTLKVNFRGETLRGGSDRGIGTHEVDFDVQERATVDFADPLGFHESESGDISTTANTRHSRRYTFGDAFCGAGGTSRGAKGAGLCIKWGFDFDHDAIASYSMNLPTTDSWVIDANKFILIVDDNFKVDILHLSPPCQPFSPAHTRPGQNDEMNQASLFAVQELLKRVKPRVATLEETFGLVRLEMHKEWFRAIINILSSEGYSVRWKIFDLRDFGLPQPRKRLFILASCPGEPLPRWPLPTHTDPSKSHLHPTLRPWASIHQAISSLPPNISLHNPLDVPTHNKPPYDAHKPLSSTITCAQGQGYHPSGKRAFTLREVACLQGFPLEHEFGEVGRGRVRRQIGNAVPPVVARVFFEEVVRSLRRVDGLG